MPDIIGALAGVGVAATFGPACGRQGDALSEVQLFNPEDLAPPIGFAHAAAAGGFVWLGGQISSDASGAVVHAGDMAGQFRRAIENVAVALRAAGSSPENVAKLTYFVTDIVAYRAALKPIGAAYREVFGRHYPATSLFEVQGLFDAEAMIEIECVAVQSRLSGTDQEDGSDVR